jgi:hypothetical protein
MNEDYKYLEEYIKNHLKEWNNTQKNIWLNLVEEGKVCKNDTFKILEFSQWFDNFFLDYGRYPTLTEVKEYFIGEEDEI